MQMKDLVPMLVIVFILAFLMGVLIGVQMVRDRSIPINDNRTMKNSMFFYGEK